MLDGNGGGGQRTGTKCRQRQAAIGFHLIEKLQDHLLTIDMR